MAKKILSIGFMVIMAISVFALSGCSGYETEKFDSLEEMQAVLPNDFYFFDFNQEGVKETGKFEVTKKEQNDGSYKYIQYFIWYEVEYAIRGQVVTRNLQVVGVDVQHTITFLGKNTISFSPQPDSRGIGANWYGIGYSAKDKRLVLTIDIKNEEGNWYYFVLDGVQNTHIADEAELFATISETMINNRYKIQ